MSPAEANQGAGQGIALPRQAQRTVACRFVSDVIPLYEGVYPKRGRFLRLTIEAAERFTRGEISFGRFALTTTACRLRTAGDPEWGAAFQQLQKVKGEGSDLSRAASMRMFASNGAMGARFAVFAAAAGHMDKAFRWAKTAIRDEAARLGIESGLSGDEAVAKGEELAAEWVEACAKRLGHAAPSKGT